MYVIIVKCYDKTSSILWNKSVFYDGQMYFLSLMKQVYNFAKYFMTKPVVFVKYFIRTNVFLLSIYDETSL